MCGSDLLEFEADYPEYPPEVGQPLHEMIGKVVDTSGDRFQVGDRVLAVPIEHNGFFERFRVHESRAILLDPRPPEDQAVLAQPLGTVIFALRKIPQLINRNVAVVGQGPMGQLFCAALRNLGAREIIAVDQVPERLAVSPQMGATAVVNIEKERPDRCDTQNHRRQNGRPGRRGGRTSRASAQLVHRSVRQGRRNPLLRRARSAA